MPRQHDLPGDAVGIAAAFSYMQAGVKCLLAGSHKACKSSSAPFDLQEYPMRAPLQTAGFGNIGLSLLSMFQVVSGWLLAIAPHRCNA